MTSYKSSAGLGWITNSEFRSDQGTREFRTALVRDTPGRTGKISDRLRVFERAGQGKFFRFMKQTLRQAHQRTVECSRGTFCHSSSLSDFSFAFKLSSMKRARNSKVLSLTEEIFSKNSAFF